MADEDAEEEAIFGDGGADDEDWEQLYAALRYVAAGDRAAAPKQRKKRAKETRKRQGRFEHQYKKGTKEARVFKPQNSTWWATLQHPDLAREETRIARRFRQKFRLPYVMVEQLKRRVVRDHPEWADWDGGGQCSHPLIMKILVALRHLASGDDFDSLEDAAHIARDTLRVWVPKFLKWMEEVLFPEEVKKPTDGELDAALEVFELLGFPGAYCSSDGVHLPWDACPALFHARYKGKETYPSVAFNVSVLHSSKIIHVSDWSAGAVNDMTQARHDKLFEQLHNRTLHPSRTFRLYKRDGTSVEYCGLYAIVDNGYHRWKCLVAPYKHAILLDEKLWSKRLESVRKNVECTFGILKKRFAILKRPLLYRNPEFIQTIFRCCCTLHNMLLAHDGRDTIGQFQGDWVAATEQLRRMELDSTRADAQDWNPPTVHAPTYREVGEYEPGYNEFRLALVEHMAYQRSRNALCWPKTSAEVRPRPTDVGDADPRCRSSPTASAPYRRPW